MSKITPPPAMTTDQISLLRRQHTDEYDDFYFDKERFAKSIEDTRDQQWLDMLAQQEPAPRGAEAMEDEQKDAARYRWLRRKVCVIQSWNFSGEKVSAAEFEFINLPRLEEVPVKAEEALDSAIDAAIKDRLKEQS